MDEYAQLGSIHHIQVLSAPQVAAQAIRGAIITAKFKPGERLVERKLAEDLGIGQPTLREALKELEYEGLVRKIPQRGTYVAKPSKNDLEKMLAVRMSLEVLAIDLAARKMTSQAEDELEGIVNEMASAAQAMNLARFNDCDVAFHRTIWTLAANEYLAKALHLVMFQLFVFGVTGEDAQRQEKFLAAAGQHNRILDALRSRDPIIARRTFAQETLNFWQVQYGISTGEMPDDLLGPVLLLESRA
jgi:DNA-binding GntR family transcriptional regulator